MTTEPFIAFSRPYVSEDEVGAVADVIRSGWWTTGSVTHQFEAEFADYVGASYAVAVNSCTAALHIALRALGLSPGELEVTSVLTFVATAEVGLYCGAIPALLDISEETGNADEGILERFVTAWSGESPQKRVRELVAEGALPRGLLRSTGSVAPDARIGAIVPVHFAGRACDMDRIGAAARVCGAPIVEDAAHAAESRWGTAKIGSISEATAFSFYATKNLSTGEGGMVTTQDEELASRMRRLTLHGISRDAWNRYGASGNWHYDVVDEGFKYNLTDIAAALGRVQLARVHDMAARRLEIVRMYRERLSAVAALELPTGSLDGSHAWHLFVVRLRKGALGIGRDEFIEELRSRGVGASVHFIPLHLHPFYREKYGYEAGDYPVAEDVYSRCVSLPLYPSLTDDEVGRVCDAVEDICDRWEEQ